MSALLFGHVALTYRELFELLRTKYNCSIYRQARPGELEDADGAPAAGLIRCDRTVRGRLLQRAISFNDENEPITPTTLGSIYRSLQIEDRPPY